MNVIYNSIILHFSNFYSLYKYYCWYNCIIRPLYSHFTAILLDFLTLKNFSFYLYLTIMWSRVTAVKIIVLGDCVVFSLHILFFWKHCKNTYDDIIWLYGFLFLLDALVLNYKVSKIISRNNVTGGKKGKCMLVQAGR